MGSRGLIITYTWPRGLCCDDVAGGGGGVSRSPADGRRREHLRRLQSLEDAVTHILYETDEAQSPRPPQGPQTAAALEAEAQQGTEQQQDGGQAAAAGGGGSSRPPADVLAEKLKEKWQAVVNAHQDLEAATEEAQELRFQVKRLEEEKEAAEEECELLRQQSERLQKYREIAVEADGLRKELNRVRQAGRHAMRG